MVREATKTPMTTLEKLQAQGTQMEEAVDALLPVFKEKTAVGKSSHELPPGILRWGNLKTNGSQLSDAQKFSFSVINPDEITTNTLSCAVGIVLSSRS